MRKTWEQSIKIKKGTIICLKNERMDKSFMVRKGRVGLFQHDDLTDQRLFKVICAGEYFCLPEDLTNLTYTYTAKALSNVKLFTMNTTEFISSGYIHPNLKLSICQNLALQIRNDEKKIFEAEYK